MLSVCGNHTEQLLRVLLFRITSDKLMINFQRKGVRSAQANKEKRKRYRCNKKRKYFQRCHSLSDDHQAQYTLDSATPVADSDLSSVHVGLGPYNMLMDEAKRFKQSQDIKKTELDRKF